ncbi:MAG: hypothetical protein R3E10_10075 [Gemmatimonadota bacterium]
MSSARWNATVVDAPGQEPFAILGDLLLAVRTPRSRDFVTVEVAPTSQCGSVIPDAELLVCSRPLPFLDHPLRGELHVGDPVDFEVQGHSYRLTLAGLQDSPAGPPWIVCDLLLERD